MRSIQYSDFVEVFNYLTALESNLGDNNCIRTVLKVPFKKVAPPPCPSDVPAPLTVKDLSLKLTTLKHHNTSFKFKFQVYW